MRFRPEDREEIADILRRLTLASRQEPGCVSYVPHAIEAEPDTVLIYEQYRDEAGQPDGSGEQEGGAVQPGLGGPWRVRSDGPACSYTCQDQFQHS